MDDVAGVLANFLDLLGLLGLNKSYFEHFSVALVLSTAIGDAPP